MRFAITARFEFPGDVSSLTEALRGIGIVTEEGSTIYQIEELPTSREGFRQIKVCKGNDVAHILSVPENSSVTIPGFSRLTRQVELKDKIREVLSQAGIEPGEVKHWVYAAAAELTGVPPGWQPFFEQGSGG